MQDGQSSRDLMTTTVNRRIMKGCRTTNGWRAMVEVREQEPRQMSKKTNEWMQDGSRDAI
uniref:Uncharacterized protein n=1 Tax=Pristionchus pacificus TaxID=54126 RepID=A0A2A6CGW7_PRIPA|eukprot:PDM77475.1 hypothetical protein PRIPAC_33062 [Pristionchus pacificus]